MSIIKEMREICQQRRPNAKGKMVWAGHWYNRLVTRHFSIYLTWLFIKMGVSANTVTFLMIPLGLVGAALCIIHVLWINILGLFLLMLVEVFDCVDGEVARWNKKSSIKGVYLDLLSHTFCNHFTKIICPLHFYIWARDIKYLILAFIIYSASICRYGVILSFRVATNSPAGGRRTESDLPSAKNAFFGIDRKWLIKVVRSLKFALSLPVDTIVVAVISVIAILISYTGFDALVIWLCWIFVVFKIFWLTVDVARYYFFELSDAVHEKKV